MLRLIVLLIFLFASIWVGHAIIGHPGYLLLVYRPWMVQMPLWLAILAVVLVLGLFYLIIAGIDQLHFWAFRFKNWLRLRHHQQALSKTQQGYAELAEQQWAKAERHLLAGMKQNYEPLINYLGAARAAQGQLAFDRRDHYLQAAYKAAPDAQIAIGLTQAKFQIEQNQLEQAVATLHLLQREAPKHPAVLDELSKVYLLLKDWSHLKNLLPALYKIKSTAENHRDEINTYVAFTMLQQSNFTQLSELQDTWRCFSKTVKRQPEVIVEYVKQLVRLNAVEPAEEIIRNTLRSQYDEELVILYSQLPFDDLNRQLVIGSNWLNAYGQRPGILLMLGRICMRVQLWGKAKDYLEKALVLGANPTAALEYGALLEQLDEPELALAQYRLGLKNCLQPSVNNKQE